LGTACPWNGPAFSVAKKNYMCNTSLNGEFFAKDYGTRKFQINYYTNNSRNWHKRKHPRLQQG
jgi:hypothetical protein